MSKEKTLEEWIEFYNRKCPEEFEPAEGFQLYYRPDKGFCEIGNTGKMIVIFQCAGDIKYWRHAAEEICKLAKLKAMGTCVCRHIKPFIRVGGFRIYRTEEIPDGERYYFKDVNTGQLGQASPAWKTDNGTLVYFFTWAVE